MADQPPNQGVKFDNGVNISKPAKRIRWATQRVKSIKASNKRSGIIARLHRSASSEKKRESGGSDSTTSQKGGPGGLDGTESSDGGDESGRKIFFNQPLPAFMKDDNGNPVVQYERNKIRTAKYTPLSFIPKNLYWQFHQIANIYFLVLNIIGVSSPPSPLALTYPSLVLYDFQRT